MSSNYLCFIINAFESCVRTSEWLYQKWSCYCIALQHDSLFCCSVWLIWFACHSLSDDFGFDWRLRVLWNWIIRRKNVRTRLTKRREKNTDSTSDFFLHRSCKLCIPNWVRVSNSSFACVIFFFVISFGRLAQFIECVSKKKTTNEIPGEMHNKIFFIRSNTKTKNGYMNILWT